MILGADFLQEHRLILDFSQSPVGVHISNVQHHDSGQQDGPWEAVWKAEQKNRSKACAALTMEDPETDAADECTIPRFRGPERYEFPECEQPSLTQVVDEFSDLFRMRPGKTTAEYHYIPTTGFPVKVPPRRIPAHYREEVEQQLQDMLEQADWLLIAIRAFC